MKERLSKEISSHEVTGKVVGCKPEANLFVTAVTADLGCDNRPTVPSPARFGYKVKKLPITKPQLLVQDSSKSTAELPAMDRAIQPIRDETESGTGPCGQ